MGDLGEVVCDAGKAERELGWKANRGVVEMCRSQWEWVERNPEGYASVGVDGKDRSKKSSNEM